MTTMIPQIQHGRLVLGLGVIFVQGLVFGAADRGYLQVVGPVPLRYRTATVGETPTPVPSVAWMDDVDGGWQGPPIPPDHFLSPADKLADLKPKVDSDPSASTTVSSAPPVSPAPPAKSVASTSSANGSSGPSVGGNAPSTPPVPAIVPVVDPGVVIQSFTQDPDAVSARSLVKYFAPLGGTNGVSIMVAPFGFTPPPPPPVPPPSSRAVYTTNPAP